MEASTASKLQRSSLEPWATGVIDAMPFGVVWLSGRNIRQVNARIVEWTGKPSHHFNGFALKDFVLKEDYPILEDFLTPDATTGKLNPTTEELSLRLPAADGAPIRVLAHLHHCSGTEDCSAVLTLRREPAHAPTAKADVKSRDASAAMLENSMVGIIKVVDHRFAMANRRFCELLGYQPGELVGVSEKVIHVDEDSFKLFRKQARQELTATGTCAVEHRFKRKDGTAIWCRIHGKWFTDVDGTKATIWVLDDITSHKRLEDDLIRLATTDPLTNVYNRRHFNETLELEIKRCRRYKHTLSLMLIDIDHFKRVNDTYGHGVGDDVLRTLCRVCVYYLRTNDIFARYGGEEFVLMCPETDLPGAEHVAERLRCLISEEAVSAENGEDVNVTVSIGVVSLTEQDESIQDLYTRADKALYAAKDAGRDRVVVG